MKLLFMDRRDVFNTWGEIRFGSTALERIAETDNRDPAYTGDFTVRCCVPHPDGSWSVYACDGGRDHTPWRIYRFRTEDGLHLLDKELVYESRPDKWSQTTTLTYSPELDLFLCLKNYFEGDGGSTYAFTSRDGTHWEEVENNPVYYEGDRWGAVWSSAVGRFITYNNGIQRYPAKLLPELLYGGIGLSERMDARRVATLRTSADGRRWEPDDPDWSRRNIVKEDGVFRYGGPFVPVEYQILPDEFDPPDLEFYAGQAFEYEGRYFLMMLNYAPSFLPPHSKSVGGGGHGPNLDTEWWVSRDGLHWDRPFRGMHASGPITEFIQHNPIVKDGKLLFHMQSAGVWGMPVDRLTYVASRANAVFETLLFPMPATPLKLNARIPGEDAAEGGFQAYVMAELVDDCGRVIAGYGRDRCILKSPQDSIELPLTWEGKDGTDFAGRKVRLRFFMRASRVYAVTG